MMNDRLRIVLGQLNLLVGDLAGNTDKMVAAAMRARDELQADAIVFPELAITGYPPEDLLLRPGFNTRAVAALHKLSAVAQGIDVLVGHPWREQGRLYNAASLLRDGAIVATYSKQCLPNYGVFDEKRYFHAGEAPCVVAIAGVPVAITICEDVWEPAPAAQAAAAGAKVLVNLNASPFHIEKREERERVVGERARENRMPIIYVNLVGGQDELVFDGTSFVVDARGEIRQRSPAFEERLDAVEFDSNTLAPVAGAVAPAPGYEQSIYQAITLGVGDYVNKNGFPGVVIGLSGGIDSALTLAIAVDALGPERVEAVLMPSRYTAAMSLEDAVAQSQALNVKHTTIPIDSMFQGLLDGLKDRFKGLPADSTEENLQARIRGMLLMAISNKTGKMVLTTGNKSEMSVGYATLYGDMAGGFAAIKDVPKTVVYRLAAYRNRLSPVIPQRVIDRPPSAELAPDQLDVDSLPPYPVLDGILERYVEHDECVEDIVRAGFDEETVRYVAKLVDRNEYKRRQAAPGVRITRRAFGRDRRYPITSGYGKGAY